MHRSCMAKHRRVFWLCSCVAEPPVKVAAVVAEPASPYIEHEFRLIQLLVPH